ncbi:MAG: Flp pilus assembly complex ATPase component TadA [Firmicutes bacterium]|nr:Flp pilus assembly complex ATPase component TadA [Bacillota bacterium]
MEKNITFEEGCRRVEAVFERDWKGTDELARMERLELEKRAIMGYEDAMNQYLERINEIIEEENLGNMQFPQWYRNLSEAVFHELYGLAGLAPWAYDQTEEYRMSSSAKIIGDRMYCLIEGTAVLQPQTIERQRREQLKRALLLSTPGERLEKGFHEIYMRNGIRITIYSGERTKDGQDVMVFRKYILQELTFEEMVRLGTIPEEAVPLFRVMIRLGFNVIFAGPVRSGKTTFMQIWQKHENPSLEGMAISTDPETPWHEIMAEAPVMQLVADGEQLENITRSLLRGDNDYVILEEMRDAQAYRLALEITSTGTRRSKATVHTGDPVMLPYTMASKIRTKYGGDTQGIILQIFRNFNYILEFCSDEDNRGRKRLKSMWEYCYDAEKDRPAVYCICRYDGSGNWKWQYHLGADKVAAAGMRPEDFAEMEAIMKDLERRNPLTEGRVIYPRYYKPALAENPQRCEL